MDQKALDVFMQSGHIQKPLRWLSSENSVRGRNRSTEIEKKHGGLAVLKSIPERGRDPYGEGSGPNGARPTLLKAETHRR